MLKLPTAAVMQLFRKNTRCCQKVKQCNSISKSMMISRRQGGGNEAYCTYFEEATTLPTKIALDLEME
jgi:hypothetical protein